MRFRNAILAIVLLATFAASAFAGDPKRAAVHNKQAKAYFDAKQFDEAIQEFKKSYELDPKPLTLYKIASAYYAKGDYKGAVEHYQKYLTADPDGPFAAQAIEFSTIANRALADEAAKHQAAIEAARVEAERKAAEAERKTAEVEAERKRLAATARIKQAEAYARANAWASAGQEYTAATGVDGDPAHLLAAAEAFRKAPDDIKARAAYLAYLDKVPAGPRSDEIRGKVAELSRAIEKAEAEERRQKDALAKASIVASTAVTGLLRRTSFGFNLRGGIYGPGSFAKQSPSVEVANKAGPAAGLGAFIDFPLLTQSHAHLGVRARTFESSYESCMGIVMCPSKVSGTFVGPAITLELSLFHHGRLDVYQVLGFSFDVPVGKGTISYDQGAQDQELSTSPLALPEVGLGVRFGSVSIDAVFQVSLNKFTSDLDLGRAVGIMVAAGWSLPR